MSGGVHADPQERARAAVRAGAVSPPRIPDVPAPKGPPSSWQASPAVDPSPLPSVVPSVVVTPARADPIPGTPKGSMRQLTLYVSAPVAAAVAAHRGPDESLGGVVMRALRDSYPELVAARQAEPSPEPVGPFPAPVRPRRRLAVPDARPLTVRVTEAEATAIGQAVEELGTTVSKLVEDAVRLRFGVEVGGAASP